ncbi:hypothetical protein F383_16205 [Gossypium arboreum]|uniref:Uncharacterized protein n=1 Tax=Gossypium arboreum TaxID=29729 RepID=A0A0B0PSP2_GOSAR|nr:hypothetical protein F383_16205 [Gossypium arboreum]
MRLSKFCLCPRALPNIFHSKIQVKIYKERE